MLKILNGSMPSAEIGFTQQPVRAPSGRSWLLQRSAISSLALALPILSAALPRDAHAGPGVSQSMFTAHTRYTCVANYYVDANVGNDSNSGSQSSPWKTIGRANNANPTAGTCINVNPGTYSLLQSVTIDHGGNLNSKTGYVVYRSTVLNGAHVIPLNSNVGDIFQVMVPYIVIDGFDIDGNNSLTTGNGVAGCVGGGGQSFIAHHMMVLNSIIHDVGGAGLASCTADYITWEHNVIYNTSQTSPYQVSGIDIGVPKNLAPGSFTPTPADKGQFHIIISANSVYDNREGPKIGSPHTDGNGIIIDSSTNSPAYTGNILIIGNLSYNNGGGGIHIFKSANVTVTNNTVYHNYQDLLNPGTARGELSNGGSQNVNWINNIAFSVAGSGVLAYADPVVSFPVGSSIDTGTWSKNIAYGGNIVSDSTSYFNPATNMIGINPNLWSPQTAEFVPVAGSPAITTGLPQSYIANPTPNIGAYVSAEKK